MSLTFRCAHRADLQAIVALLADDDIGKDREMGEHTSLTPYETAWTAMESEPYNKILVATKGGEVAGVLQLTLIAGLSRGGMKRAQIEGVRVGEAFRGQQVGRRLMSYAMEIAREEGCGLVQLTTDKRRVDAKRFYESMGFFDSHEGMKIVF